MKTSHTANLLGALSLALTDAQLAAAQQASGQSASACSVLITLGLYPGLSIGALAKIAGLTHSVMVRMVESLAQQGLLQRIDGPDRRTVALQLTAAGHTKRGQIITARAAVLHTALSHLAEPHQAALADIADTLLAALTTSRTQADHLCRLCDEQACGENCPVERQAQCLTGQR